MPEQRRAGQLVDHKSAAVAQIDGHCWNNASAERSKMENKPMVKKKQVTPNEKSEKKTNLGVPSSLFLGQVLNKRI